MAINVAINGFGRIGRQAFRAGFANKKIKFVAINDLASPQTLAHLLRYDTAYGQWPVKVEYDEKNIIVDGKKIVICNEKDPSVLPWAKLKVDIVIESTGHFTDKAGAELHLKAGAKKVLISAPAKGIDVPTYLLSINGEKSKSEKSAVINMGSCTTNCTAPVTAILEEKFGIDKAMMSTIHAYTGEQNLHDAPPPGLKAGDLRRARAAAQNIVPTSTGAAKSVAEALPAIKGKFEGIAFRVPVVTGSLIDLTVVTKKNTTVEEVNAAFVAASKQKRFAGILRVSTEPLVSSDYIGNTASATVDLPLTKVVGGTLVKVIAWYDNEVGYSHRLIELIESFA